MLQEGYVPDDESIRKLLEGANTIAVVGLSDKEARPSHGVGKYLHEQGYTVIPVNPNLDELWGLKAYPDLTSVKEAGHEIDVVDVFRRPEAVPPIVDEAIDVGAKAVWLQEGVVNEDAAQKAKDAGLTVVMDRCAFKEHRRLGVGT